MRNACRIALALSLAALLAQPAFAQRQKGQGRGGMQQGGVGRLLDNEGVQKELKMDADQVEKTKAAVQKVREQHQDEFTQLRDLSQEERATKSRELTKVVSTETFKAIGEILKPEQIKRLKQIELQQAGSQAFTRPEVEENLKLTAEQKDKIKTISDDAAKERRELFQAGGGGGKGGGQANREKMAALTKQTTEKIQAVLTDEQKKTWQDLTGEPFQVQFQRRQKNN